MGSLAEQYHPAAVEKAARALWATRGFPRPDGVVGRGTAPLLHQYEGAYTVGDDPGLVLFRAVAADVTARYLAIAGRRALGTLRHDEEVGDDHVAPLLRALSVWVGGEAGLPYDTGDRRDRVEAILGRMAGLGLVVTRDASLRICPHCASPRSPERIVYAEEEGDTYLVRFGTVDNGRRVQLLVWVDAPWRLLGATALLLNPELPYVVARYRRKDVDELVLTSRSSLARLVDWLPGAEVEVVEEHLGSHWSGRPYEYPLRAEFPMGGELTAPGGTLQAVPDVGDSGTGIVPLVPGHGGTDAQIAERIGVTGWPLVTTRGQLARTLMHKYAGLDLATASEFVLRDLGDSGAVFAHLRVRRGVPHCAICGTSLVWAPGRAWCLEPSRLPPERRAAYLRLLPRDPPMSQIEVAAWPVSDSTTQPPGRGNATLLECPQCERLEPLGADPACGCGGTRRPVTRPLLPSIGAKLGAWARFDPFPPGDAVWIYLNERRRAPALTHHLAVMSGVVGAPADLGLTVLPGGSDAAVAEPVAAFGADAVRCAVVRGELAQQPGSTLAQRSAQEGRLLTQYWQIAREILERIDPTLLTALGPSIAGFLSELEVEDRAVLARWERVRVATIADYDGQSCARAYRRLSRFLSNDLPRYRALVAPRLEPAAAATSRRAALRTLHHLLRESSLLLGPVAPHTSELVYGATTSAGTSLFEASLEPVNANLVEGERASAWDRWQTVLDAVGRFRTTFGIPSATPLPSVVVVVGLEDEAQALRSDRPTLERLARVGHFEAFGPATPWPGRRRELEPVLSEIQKVYPSEATQIAHILRHQQAHRRDASAAAGELSVVLQGTPRRILPAMVTYTERLPERMVPASWRLGEMYVELPAAHPLPARIPPPLSPDAFCLVRRVERELRRRASTPGPVRPPLVVATLDPLAKELRRVAPALATYLGVPEVRVIDDVREFPLSETTRGRTKTGVRWWLHLPGLAPRPGHVKQHPSRPAGLRIRPSRPSSEMAEASYDYASPEHIAREEQVRALMGELDGVLGAPLLGFAKTAGAWDSGLQSRAAFEAASFDTLAALPGFGWPLAEALVVKFGRTPPPRPSWGLRRAQGLATERDGSSTGVGSGPTVSVEPARGVAPTGSGDLAGASPGESWPGTRSEFRPARGVAPSPSLPARAPELHAPLAPLSQLPQVAAPAPLPPPLPVAAVSPVPPPVLPVDAVEPGAPPPEQAPLPLQGIPPTAPPPPTAPEPGEREDETHPATHGPPRELPPFGSGLEETEPPTGPTEPLPPGLDGAIPTEVPPPATSEAGPADLEISPEQIAEEPPVATGESDAEDAGAGPPTGEVESIPSSEGPVPEMEASPTDEPPSAPPEASFESSSSLPTPPPEVLEEVPSTPQAPPGVEPAEPLAEAPMPELAADRLPLQPEEAAAPSSEPTPPASVQLPAVSAPEPLALPSTIPVQPALAVPSPAALSPVVPPTPPMEAVAPSEPVPAPPAVIPWGVQVIVSPSYLLPLREFLDMTSAGHRGVAVVRESPERLRTHIGPRPAEVYWLTNLGRGLTVKPNDLAAYGAFLETAVDRDRVTAFFLEGIEYLVRLHGIDRMVALLTTFHAQAVAHEARVWVCVHPNLIAPADLDRLVAAFAHS